ncbi:MAG: hypothetical protein P8M65_14495 [Roseibacillus sp.]|nr:hypothetical protein [Roseibacillus sp.]
MKSTAYVCSFLRPHGNEAQSPDLLLWGPDRKLVGPTVAQFILEVLTEGARR